MDAQGDAVLGVGKCADESDLQTALTQALSNPLVSSVDMSTSTGVIVQINCVDEISLGSYNTIMDTVRQQVSPNAVVICGASKITSLANNFEILVIATGAKSKLIKSNLWEETPPQAEPEKAPKRVVSTKNDIFDIPAFIRSQSPAPSGK